MRIGFPGLGTRLRVARRKRGLSQEAAAELVDVSWITIHRWERDQRCIPQDKLIFLADLYGQSMRWFLTLEAGDVDPLEARGDWMHRICERVAQAPRKYQMMIERVVGDMLDECEKAEREG